MLWLCFFFFSFFLVVLFQMFLSGSMVEKSRSQFWKFQVFEEDGCENPASPNLDSSQPNLQVPQNHHGTQSVATDLPHWQPCHHREMPQKLRYHRQSQELSLTRDLVTLPISLLYDGSIVLDGCVAVNLGLGFSLNLGILAETYGVNLIFLDWWHKICYEWKPN